MNIKDLEYLFSRDALSKLSKNPKKIYKNYLGLIFTATLNKITVSERKDIYNGLQYICFDILRDYKNYTESSLVESTGKLLRIELNTNFIKNADKDSTIDIIISFMRKVIKSRLEGERYLTNLKELNGLISVKAYLRNYYNNSNKNLEHHHWIEFDLEKGLIHTFPEFITYAHLVSLWNIFLEKRSKLIEYREQHQKILAQDIIYDVDIRLEIRAIESQMQALINSLIVQGITFIESYLYYIYYNVKSGNYKLKSDKAKKFIKVSDQPNDEDIFTDLIKPEYLNEVVAESKILMLYTNFKEINKIRNRLIHASAFSSNKKSHLIPLISIGTEELIYTLELCTSFLLEIENVLPEELKILFWWNSMEHPNFNEYKPGNYIKRTDI